MPTHIHTYSHTDTQTHGHTDTDTDTDRHRHEIAAEDVQSAWFVVKTMSVDVFDTLTLSFLLDENILGK